jgi:hypothetical protein
MQSNSASFETSQSYRSIAGACADALPEPARAMSVSVTIDLGQHGLEISRTELETIAGSAIAALRAIGEFRSDFPAMVRVTLDLAQEKPKLKIGRRNPTRKKKPIGNSDSSTASNGAEPAAEKGQHHA